MRIDRRRFLTAVGAGVAASAVGAHGARPAGAQGARQVVVGSWGGSYQDALRKAWFQPFEKETGIKVVDVSPISYGKLGTMVETGNVEWDVVDVGSSFVATGVKKNLFEPLDFSIIDKSGLFPEAVNEHAVAVEYFSTVLAYRTKGSAARPASWADFWDVKKVPGVRALRKIGYATLEAALMADGVPVDRIYPLDVDRAFRSLDRIKPHVKVWWTQGAQPIQLLTDGEVDITPAWSPRLDVARKEGAQVDYTWNQGVLQSSSFIVPRGSRNREAAMRLIAYSVSPQPQARLSLYSPNGPANARAYEFIKPETARTLPTSPENRARQVLLAEFGWWAKHFDDVEKRFQDWVAR
jgi:putative spermidine/putrescine transport system substrate-binding protein